MREREKIREREVREDAQDRAQEQRELASQQKQRDQARGQADAFLDQQADELERTREHREPQHFKISLGAAAKKLETAAAPRRTAADVENLLEDEEVADQTGGRKRALVPINFDAAVRANLTQEEVEDAQRQLARDIPNDKEGLWKWPISWEHLPEKNIDKDIKDWAANKVLELMGLQEEMLVDAIVEHLKSRGGPQALVENLEVVSSLLTSTSIQNRDHLLMKTGSRRRGRVPRQETLAYGHLLQRDGEARYQISKHSGRWSSRQPLICHRVFGSWSIQNTIRVEVEAHDNHQGVSFQFPENC